MAMTASAIARSVVAVLCALVLAEAKVKDKFGRYLDEMAGEGKERRSSQLRAGNVPNDHVDFKTVVPKSGPPRQSVPFSLRDARGRDLVAEAAKLRQSGSGKGPFGEPPATPLEMGFTTEGVAFSLKLERAPSVFTSRAAIVDGQGKPIPGLKITNGPVFRCKNYGAVLVVVNGTFRGLMRANRSTLEFDADPATGTLNVHDVVAARPETREDHGVVESDGEAGDRFQSEPPGSYQRDTHGPARNFDPEAIDRWTDCYSNDDVTRAFSTGVVVAATMAANLGNDAQRITEELQRTYANANMVYTPQLNFVLMIDQIYIPSLAGDTVSWDSCAGGIDDQFDGFKYWDPPSRQGIWHLFDDCFVTSGTIGLATLGDQWNGMCEMDSLNGCANGACYRNRGVTWLGSSTWLTFAHEVGHNFGADHAFENGQTHSVPWQ